MPKFVAFLRAINVGGHVVRMSDLQRHFEALGLSDVETFIASGNVVFSAKSRNLAQLERKIETHLHKTLGYEVSTFIRTLDEVQRISQLEPFDPAQHQSSPTYVVGFLAVDLEDGARKSLMALRSEFDDFHIDGRELYWLSRRKQSESVFSNAVFEKTLKRRTTFRGMNTLKRLAAKYSGSPESGD